MVIKKHVSDMLIALSALSLSSHALAHHIYLKFASIEELAEQKIAEEVITHVYDKIGIDVIVFSFPGKRAESEVYSGQLDGEVMRIYSYGETNPEVFRVPTPYYYLETMGFVHKDNPVSISNLDDLKNYMVIKVRGVKHTDNATKGLTNVIEVNNSTQGMKMISKGRGDVFLTNTIDGDLVINQLGLDNVRQLPTPLAVESLYHYIHKQNAEYVDIVDEIIISMKESGELQKIVKQAEANLLNETKSED